jgi:exopolyphosphatase / guanosine-5'-triphosphate,3'-diphosphate pyrophosphatase
VIQSNSKLDAIVSLAKRYDYDRAHAHQVECLAGTLFMELEPLHQLSREDRKLLEYAAIVHDIGYFLSSASHHKHSMNLLLLEALPQLTRSEKLIVANLARYHRKAFPSSAHAAFAILSEREQRTVELLAPILRIADGLDKTHSSRVTELSCSINNGFITIYVTSNQDLTEELQAVDKRSEMFKIVYGLDVKTEVLSTRNTGQEAVV